jgi:hypothetical protein
MPDATLLREANDLLYKELGGQSDSLPNYRIIWSTAVTEKRHGVFNDFYGKIFVRTYEGVREVIKYPYDQDRYILERLEDARGNRELIEPYSYEPLYVFKDKRGFYLPLNMKVVKSTSTLSNIRRNVERLRRGIWQTSRLRNEKR